MNAVRLFATVSLLALAGLAQARPDAGRAASGNDRKAAILRATAANLDKSTAPLVGRGHVAAAEAALAAAEKRGDGFQVYNGRLALADAKLWIGRIDDALADYGKCLDMAVKARDNNAWAQTLKKMALAWMRFGERANCVTNHNQDSCIFPLKGGAIHVDRRGSEEAIKLLLSLVSHEPGDLASVWLLNIAHMTLGTWPDGVPASVRIPARALESERAMPRMLDVAAPLGLATRDLAGGAIIDDFDGDGTLEIVTSSMDQHEPLHFFKRQPDGTFANIADALGLGGQLGGLQIMHFDANNDGRLDLLVQRGAWLGDFGKIPNSLLIQQENGTFLDRTLEAGVEIAMPSQVACVADIDLDGDLDLFLGYEQPRGAPLAHPCKLFRNRGDGTFEDITTSAGVANASFCKGAAFGDFDGDGRPDLYVSNLHDDNRLYRNEGDGRFKDVAVELGVHHPLDSFACWFFDYNNDGWLDIFVTSYQQTDRAACMTAFYRNRATGFDTQRLYENDGRGGFRDVTVERSLDRVAFTMGCGFGDIDNDGFQDIYLATGDPEFASLWPNVMYRNDAGRRFEDVTAATGTGHLQKGHGVAFADIDEDGDQDLFEQLGGALPDDGFGDVLFENPGHGNRWITVRVIGRDSNRFGVGSRIKATIEEGTGQRDVYQFVGAVSSFGGDSLQAEIGLGQASRIVALEVYWPRTGKTQRFADVPLDRIVVVDESKLELTVIAPRHRPLEQSPAKK